jgi:hypothetical protein
VDVSEEYNYEMSLLLRRRQSASGMCSGHTEQHEKLYVPYNVRLTNQTHRQPEKTNFYAIGVG